MNTRNTRNCTDIKMEILVRKKQIEYLELELDIAKTAWDRQGIMWTIGYCMARLDDLYSELEEAYNEV